MTPPPSSAISTTTTAEVSPSSSASAAILLSAPPPPPPLTPETATKQPGRTRSAAAQAISQTSSSNHTLGSLLLASITRSSKPPSSPSDVEAQLGRPPHRQEEQPQYFTLGPSEHDDDEDDEDDDLTVTNHNRGHQGSHLEPLRSAKHSSDPPSSATTSSYDEIGSAYWDPAAEARGGLEDDYELEEQHRPQRSISASEQGPHGEDSSRVYTSESAALLPTPDGVNAQTTMPGLQPSKPVEAPPFEPLSRQEKIWMSFVASLVGVLSLVALLISEDVIDWPGDGIGKD